MALTKARPPVTAVSTVENTTTKIDIPSAAGPVDINIAGLNVLDLTATTAIFDDLVTLTANLFTGESIILSTSGGATATAVTEATKGKMGTTTSHILELLQNNLARMTLNVDGTVSLATVGTAVGHLVDKAYVDAASDLVKADIVAVNAKPGSIRIPTSLGIDFKVNWGETGILNNATTTETFNLAFASSALVGFATRSSTDDKDDNAAHVGNLTLTTVDVTSAGDGTSVFWIVFGF